MFPTGLPSIARLKAKFDPKFAGLRTIKRPAGRARRAAAVSIEAAQRKTRIRKSVVTDVNLDFIPSRFLGIRFWQAWRVHPNDRHGMEAHRKLDQRHDDLCADGLRKGAQNGPAVSSRSFDNSETFLEFDDTRFRGSYFVLKNSDCRFRDRAP